MIDNNVLAEFRKWLKKKGYSESVITAYSCYVKILMKSCNIYDEESVKEFLWKKPNYKVRNSYTKAYNRFKEFLSSKCK